MYKKADKFSKAAGMWYINTVNISDYSHLWISFFNIGKGAGRKSRTNWASIWIYWRLYHSHDVVGNGPSRKETGLIPRCQWWQEVGCDICTLGAGVIIEGQTQEQGGQAGGMSIQVDSPIVHPKLILGYHVIPNKWLLQGGTVGGGGTLKWFSQELGAFEEELAREREISPYEIMSEEAERISPGSNGLIFLPYMAGERSPIWDSRARGCSLASGDRQGHMIRSIMEGGFRFSLKTARRGYM